MQMSEPQPSQYDWRFQLFGFPTRVTWLFWAVSAALGYSAALGIQRMYSVLMGVNVHFALLLAIWVGVSFVSILIHELGHALAFRFYGIQCQIVLYQMGGLAIPGAGMLWGNMGRKRQLTHLDQIVVSAAGPAIQLLLACFVGVVAILCGITVREFSWLTPLIGIKTSIPKDPFVFSFVYFMVTINVWWALLNLLPIYPLDGGQITQHIIGIVRRNSGLMEAYAIGALVGALVAFWFFQRGSTFNALFLASMAVSNFQAMQAGNGPRYW
ncbi:MAG: M50 family metallopeptidase [Pirellula sp.]